MINIIWFFLPAILALGTITSIEDIKFGKIRNKWILSAIIYAIITNIGLIIYYNLTTGINTIYVLELITNITFATLIGYGLWHYNIWSAGDGKLFIAYTALLPLTVYSAGYQQWIPSITLLVNIFVVGLFFMLGLLLFKTRFKDLKKVLKEFLEEFFKPMTLIESIISFFAIFWVLELLLAMMGLSQSYMLRLVLTMLVFSNVKKKLGDKMIYLMSLIAIIRFSVDKSVYSWNFLLTFLMFLFTWKFLMSLFRGSLSKLGSELFTKQLNIDELKPKMILSDDIIKTNRRPTEGELETLKKNPAFQLIHQKGSYYLAKPKNSTEKEIFIKQEAEGLTLEQVNTIKKLGFKTINVSQVMPFAHLIFLGVLMTVIVKGNLLILFKTLLMKLFS